jgi:DNA-binding Lrp family transcriptional regulator
MAGLDSTDCRILQSLQVDASQSLADIAGQEISRTTAVPMLKPIPNWRVE